MENHQEKIILAGAVELSPESPPTVEQPGVPVVGIDIPLGLDVEEPVESPPAAESPSPALSDDGEVFMNIYDGAELFLLKDWMEHTRITQGSFGYVVVSPLKSERLKTFLQVLYGPQWEAKFLKGGEMLLAQLKVYVSGIQCWLVSRGNNRTSFFTSGPRWSSGLSWRNWLSPAASSRWCRPPGRRLVVESLLFLDGLFTVGCSSLW